MFGQMRASRERDDRAARARHHRWVMGLARKYGMPDDLAGLVPEFERALLRNVPPERMAEALIDVGHYPPEAKKLKWRCRLFGCKPQGPCYLSPYCTACEDRCIRCNHYIVPKATARAG